jgi:hypothetical protein
VSVYVARAGVHVAAPDMYSENDVPDDKSVDGVGRVCPILCFSSDIEMTLGRDEEI